MKNLITLFALLPSFFPLDAQNANSFNNLNTSLVTDNLAKVFSYSDPDRPNNTELGYLSFESGTATNSSNPSTFDKIQNFGFSVSNLEYDEQKNELYAVGTIEEEGFNIYRGGVILNADSGELIKKVTFPEQLVYPSLGKDRNTGNYIVQYLYINPNDSSDREFRLSNLNFETGDLTTIKRWDWNSGVNSFELFNLIDQDLETGKFIALYSPIKGRAPKVVLLDPITGDISNIVDVPRFHRLMGGGFSHTAAYNQITREVYVSNSEISTPGIFGDGVLDASLEIYKIKLETNEVTLFKDYGKTLGAALYPQMGKMAFNHDTNNLIVNVNYFTGPLSTVPAIVKISSTNGDFLTGNEDVWGINPRFNMSGFVVKDKNEALSKPVFNKDTSSFIYPNPVKDILTIVNNANNSNLEIMTLLGQVVLSKKIKLNTNRIDVSSLSSGTYLVKIVNENNSINTSKLVIE